MIPWINNRDEFPPAGGALREPNGLLCAGDDLTPARIVAAYRRGIFPWFSDGQPVLWWSPDPRMVLLPADFKVSKSLGKTIRAKKFEVRFDGAFDAVIRGCAVPREIDGGTWIVDDMIDAYSALHAAGIAHCAESWQEGELVGGLYGIALGKVFFGESMFTRRTDASKVAFVALVDKLQQDGFALIDCQQKTRHLASFGAQPIPRKVFLQQLAELINSSDTSSSWRVGEKATTDCTDASAEPTTRP